MIRERLDLPRAALSACLRWHNLGDAPLGIAENPVWRSADAEREHDEAIADTLRAHGLLDAGHLEPDFLAALRVVAAPRVEYSCWAQDDAGSYRAAVTVRGRRAILLIRTGERLLMRDANAERPADELVAPLPTCAPARAMALNVRRADFHAALNADGTDDAGSPEAHRLLAVLRQPRTYAAELHVATRDRAGLRHRAVPRTMLDTERGRWLITRHPGTAPPEDWITATPASDVHVVAALGEMRESAH